MASLIEIKSCPRPILSVCIPCIGSRWDASQTLLHTLRVQAAKLGNVEVLCCLDDGETPCGAKRHQLSIESKGDYIAFIDDDDSVTDDYAESLVEGCRDNPEVVSFNLLKINAANGLKTLWEFSLNYPNGLRIVVDGQRAMGMTTSHLCAWRRDIARIVAFPPNLGYNEPCLWFMPLIATGWVKSEVHLPKILYHYDYNMSETANQTRRNIRRTFRWASGGIECFKQDREVFIATQGANRIRNQWVIECRDKDNRTMEKDRSMMDLYYVWRPR